LETKDIEKARVIYATCKKMFSQKEYANVRFAKLYKNFAEFEIRQGNLDVARKIYGQGMGEWGTRSKKIFQWYAQMECSLGKMDRARRIFEEFCVKHRSDPMSWISFAELESSLEDYTRAREVFEIALRIPEMDRPELLWKKYIDLEVDLGRIRGARKLYERLLQKAPHVRVFKTYALFESEQAVDVGILNAESLGEIKRLVLADEEGNQGENQGSAAASSSVGPSSASSASAASKHKHPLDRARAVYERGTKYFKEEGKSEERAMLLEDWLGVEQSCSERRLDELEDLDEEGDLDGIAAEIMQYIVIERQAEMEQEEKEEKEDKEDKEVERAERKERRKSRNEDSRNEDGRNEDGGDGDPDNSNIDESEADFTIDDDGSGNHDDNDDHPKKRRKTSNESESPRGSPKRKTSNVESGKKARKALFSEDEKEAMFAAIKLQLENYLVKCAEEDEAAVEKIKKRQPQRVKRRRKVREILIIILAKFLVLAGLGNY
jgi:hypothetical protein